ncbi:MAG: hypothetical protein IPP36_09390 [Nitrosomonadales bacterium]|nr:hypothetical protein [Nitrosomonadales bacterium]
MEIPVAVPYLSPDEGLVEDWRKRMPHTGSALKVGLVWAGSPGNKNDLNRSISLSQLDLLGTVENVVFFNLQKGSGEAQAKQPLANLHFIGLTEDIGDFASTALIANLDLVICVDTSVAHLAGLLANQHGCYCHLRRTGAGCWRGKIVRGIRPCACSANAILATGKR